MRALALSLLLAPALARPAPSLAVPSRIDAVTVFLSGARVARAAHVDLPGGPARVVLAGLPAELDDDSIRVEGHGAARARVFGVSVERVASDAAVAADARAAEERLERLQDEDRGLEDRARAAQARLDFVRSLRSTYSEERAKNLAVRGVTAKEWTDLSGFVSAELLQGGQEIRKLEISRREVGRRVAQARAELDKVQAKRGRVSKSVAVEVDSDRGGPLDLRVSYAVPSAGWQPVWDARLAPENGTMELAFQGSIWQRTGEDWGDVTLQVSTAQPARGLFVPQLEPRYLVRAEPPRPRPFLERGALKAAAPAAAAPAPEADAAEAQEEQVALEAPSAAVDAGMLSATFTTPRRETVDGSGRARKIQLARFPLKAAVTRTSAPRLEPAAFLTAKATNETGVPLLPGTAGVYVGDQFVGRAAIPATPAGGEVELAFGADERLEIERRVLDRRHESAGLISKDEVWRYRVRITVKSRWATPVTLRLLDLVPVSRDERIGVKVLDGTTPATREDPERPGVRAWELALGAREERAVEVRYEVRYPRGFPVAGLE